MIKIDSLKKPQKLKYRLLTLKYNNEYPDIIESDLLDEILKWIRENLRANIWNVSIYIKEQTCQYTNKSEKIGLKD